MAHPLTQPAILPVRKAERHGTICQGVTGPGEYGVCMSEVTIKVGDVVRLIGGTVTGMVIRVVQTRSLPAVTVMWPRYASRHVVTQLEQAGTIRG